MKFKILVMVLILNTYSYADTTEQLPYVGGKFGHNKTELKNDMSKSSISLTRNLRNDCYSYVHARWNLHARWWNYYLWNKVRVKAYTQATYGTSTGSCNIPWYAPVISASLSASEFYNYGVVCSDSETNYNASYASAICERQTVMAPIRIYHANSTHRAGSMTGNLHINVQ